MPSTTTTPAALLEDLDRLLIVHPHQSGDNPERQVMVRGEGSVVWDAAGREYLDMSGGGNWAVQVGHGRAELARVAGAQMAELAYFSAFFGYSNDKAVRLAARLVDLSPDSVERVFFTNGGSEGTESAIKFARLFHFRRGEPDRTWIISRQFAYHGSTLGSGTATGLSMMQVGVGPTLPHVELVSPPYPSREADFYGGQDTSDFLLDELEKTIERLGAGNIAAMIGEPIMGGGGILIPPADYWPRVRELLSKHGILLIADEVVTAFGRTGVWFESERQGMRPDMIVTAKGLTSGYQPLGAVLMSDAIADTISGDYLFHGHTYSGHPTACAVALANLDLIEADGLLARSDLIGGWFQELLAPLADHPLVGDLRFVGATAGIELISDQTTRTPLLAHEVTTEMRRTHSIVLREYGPTAAFSPPLVLTREQAEVAVNALIEVLSRLNPDGTIRPQTRSS